MTRYKDGLDHRITHGQSKTRLYNIWQGMKQRCYDSNTKEYRLYGERGIGICKEWMTSTCFLEWAMGNGYEDHLTIDRINNDGNYEPDNCRWATLKEQARNKRNTHTLSIGAESMCISAWSALLDIPINTIVNRLSRGLSDIDALSPDYHRRTHGVPGIIWIGSRGKWRVRAVIEGVSTCIGSFVSFDDAISSQRAAEVT